MKESQNHIQRVEEIINSARIGLWSLELYDHQKPRMYASDMMLETLGMRGGRKLSPEEVYDAWYARICPDAKASVDASIANMITGKHEENTYKWHHPETGIRYVRSGGTGYKENGKGYRLQGYHYDVTEQVRREQERTVVIDSLAKTYLCLFHIDLEAGSYTSYYNSNTSVQRVIPPQGYLVAGLESFARYLVTPEYSDTIRSFTDLSTIRDRLMKKDKIATQFIGVDNFWCEVIIRVCNRNEHGVATHLIMGIRDINEQKKAEMKHVEEIKQNIENDKHKTEFLQNMTHEIRTPLNAMFGFGQLLAMPDVTLTQQEKDEYLNHIYNSYNILTMLIDDVLDLADAAHGNYRTIIDTVCVNEVCRNALDMAMIRVQEGVNMYFTTEVDNTFTIQSDARRIQQLLVNYLSNACKHTTRGEIRLHCSTSENPGHVTFSVTDTGEGIPASMAENIFERYKKLNKNSQGSGLGLNICRIISEKLHGRVLLDTNYTNGARFLFIV